MDGVIGCENVDLMTPVSIHQKFSFMLLQRLEALEDNHERAQAQHTVTQGLVRDLDKRLVSLTCQLERCVRNGLNDRCGEIANQMVDTMTSCGDLVRVIVEVWNGMTEMVMGVVVIVMFCWLCRFLWWVWLSLAAE